METFAAHPNAAASGMSQLPLDQESKTGTEVPGGMDYEWPKYYPDRCPPSDAFDIEGIGYRYVLNNPPNSDDFVSIRVEQPHRRVSDECEACGLSVLRDESEAIAALSSLRRRVPGFREKIVAEGDLKAAMGLIKATPSRRSASHHTWWVPVGVDPSTCFSVISEDRP